MANGAILGQSTTTWTNNQILSSVSAALYSLGANATPDQVFAAIRPLITTAQNSANNAQSAANTAQQAANNASAAASTAQNTANNALNIANGRSICVSGTYVGDNTDSRFINLGFTPKAVICFARGIIQKNLTTYFSESIAVTNGPAIPRNGLISMQIDTGGFTVFNKQDGSDYAYMNQAAVYNYIAFS